MARIRITHDLGHEAAKPTRYGAQNITNDGGEGCCCHMVSLAKHCAGCSALELTRRAPTLVGVSGPVDEFTEQDD